MKIVTQDYGCGTSSSILDYKIKDVVLVSPDNYEHIFDINDDLFFIGHDFLFFLWDTQEKIERWKNNKYRKAVWCFERINAIIPEWREKSHASIKILKMFVDEIYACDEDDCNIYGYTWFPQWASPIFFEKRHTQPTNNKILFSGQAGIPEYSIRNNLINSIQNSSISHCFNFSNFKRTLLWNDYIDNLIDHSFILNPFGVLRAYNVRTYEVLYSGRMLIQQEVGEKYKRHQAMISQNKNVILFNDKLDLNKIYDYKYREQETKIFFDNNNIFSRFKKIGIDLK